MVKIWLGLKSNSSLPQESRILYKPMHPDLHTLRENTRAHCLFKPAQWWCLSTHQFVRILHCPISLALMHGNSAEKQQFYKICSLNQCGNIPATVPLLLLLSAWRFTCVLGLLVDAMSRMCAALYYSLRYVKGTTSGTDIKHLRWMSIVYCRFIQHLNLTPRDIGLVPQI